MKPFIIGVGGAHSGAGKTSYASLLLGGLKGWGAIKYTNTAFYSSVTDDPAILAEEDKDTRRFLDAGAERVLWIQSPASDIGDVFSLALDKLHGLKGIIIEGNSLIEFLKPDIIIFIFGDNPAIIKDGAEKILNRADIVVCEGEAGMVMSGNARFFGRSPEDREKFAAFVTGIVETREEIKTALSRESRNGLLPCAFARKIAEELNVSYKEIGHIADELGVRITECELGCF